MRGSVEHRVCYAALALKFLVVLLFVIVASAVADIHPVPLEKNADSAKCLECHNSDDNREFGGTGPNGPHGSKFTHILERRYEFSQAAVPGQLISNLFPSPDLTVNGPYALCGKCHDLSQVMSNTSFSDAWTTRSAIVAIASATMHATSTTASVVRRATPRTEWEASARQFPGSVS